VDLYYEIWELFIESNPSCNIYITTNATVYTEKVKRVLEKLNCQIIVSLDSLTKDTYESIRRNAVFSRTMSNLEAFTAVNRRKEKGLGLAICPMTSNWRELPEMISFANSRGMLVFFNTVLFPKHLSLKYLSNTQQSEILTYFRESLKHSANPLEDHNNRALEDFCQQVQLWMDEKQDSPADLIKEKCKTYLDRFSQETSGRLQSLLSLLSAECPNQDDAAAAAVLYDRSDPKQNLREYFGALWRVGSLLTADGLMSGTKYRERDMEEYLALLEVQFPETTLQAMYRQSARFPMEVLQVVGTSSPQELIERAKIHFPA
jgi:hypothetical protein